MHSIFTQQPETLFPLPFSQLVIERIQYLASSCIQHFSIYTSWRCWWISQFLNVYPFFLKIKTIQLKASSKQGKNIHSPKGLSKWALPARLLKWKPAQTMCHEEKATTKNLKQKTINVVFHNFPITYGISLILTNLVPYKCEEHQVETEISGGSFFKSPIIKRHVLFEQDFPVQPSMLCRAKGLRQSQQRYLLF